MPELTIEEFKKQMQAREKITLTMLDNQTAEIMKDEALFKDLLDMLARHVTTSVSNTILVQAQLPDATAVTSIAEWEKDRCLLQRMKTGITRKASTRSLMTGSMRTTAEMSTRNTRYTRDMTQSRRLILTEQGHI